MLTVHSRCLLVCIWLIYHLALLQADKLKAALIQYKENQPFGHTNKELKSDTPDTSKDVAAKKASLSASEKRSSVKSTTPKTNDYEVSTNSVQSVTSRIIYNISLMYIL